MQRTVSVPVRLDLVAASTVRAGRVPGLRRVCQSQDPLDPMDNDQMLNQISQLRSIGATDKLTNTLDSVLLGQNITSSTALIEQPAAMLA